MKQLPMLTDLAVILGVALFAGLVARRFRQSALLAYLVGGIIIGPHGLKIIEGGRELQALAEIGVALLMFTLGVEFSLRGLSNVRDFAIYGGVLQVMLTTVLGFVLGRLLGFSVIQSAYLGCVIAISSTVIVLRTLQERGEQETPHGRALIGILIVQDLAVVAMMGILPLLSNFTLSRLPELGASLLKAASYLILVLVLAKSWIPWVLRKVAASGSKELFALTILAVIFAAALGTQAIGFSLAIGAFIAGLIVSESEFSHEVLAEVAPLRDVFAIVFFVSLGMLVNLQLFVRYLVPIIACVVLIIIGKLLVGGGVALGFGYRMRSALLIGLGLTQVGEFSFVIAQDGLARGAVDLKFYSVILSSALITIVLTPALLAIGNGLYNQMIKVVDLDRFFGWRAEPRSLSERIELSDHVILLGYGRVGRSIGGALERFGFQFVVVDFDLRIIEELRAVGIAAIYGEAAHEAVLRRVNPETALMAVIALPDMISTSIATRLLLKMNPQLKIVARVQVPEAVNQLYLEGVDEVVEPDFEAGIEMMRHTLLRLGVPLTEAQAHATRIRQYRYPALAEAPEKTMLEEVHSHYIICGYGRLGRQISDELLRADIHQVVVEVDPDSITRLAMLGIPVVLGNAHEETILIRAGAERACGLVAATSSDAENLYITASARRLNPDIYIIARTNRPEDEVKFIAAGANRVVYPYGMGAKSMAVEILRPHVAAFLETLIKEEAVDWKIGEAPIGAESSLVNQTLQEAVLRERTGVTVIGIQTIDGDIIRNPPQETLLRSGDVLIALGERDQLQQLRALAESGPPEIPPFD